MKSKVHASRNDVAQNDIPVVELKGLTEDLIPILGFLAMEEPAQARAKLRELLGELSKVPAEQP